MLPFTRPCGAPCQPHRTDLKDRYQILRGKKLVISGDPTHLQFLSYEDVKELLSGFFEIQEFAFP